MDQPLAMKKSRRAKKTSTKTQKARKLELHKGLQARERMSRRWKRSPMRSFKPRKGRRRRPEAGGQGQESGREEALSPGRRPARPWPKSGATRRSRRGVPPSPIRSVPVLPGHQEVTGSSFVAVVVLKHKSSGKAALCVARQVIIHMFVDICRLTWLALNEIQQLSHVRFCSSLNSQPPFPVPLLFPFPLSPFPFLFPLSLCSFPFLFPSTLSPFVFPFTLSSLLFPFTLFTYDHCECHKWSYHHVHSILWAVWWKYQ